jgi:phosphonate metabolism protein (transferase hexapeptide repeat family)
MWRASQSHFTYRASAYFEGQADENEFFDWRRKHNVTIGHDVWIGHGAVILAGRKVGTGAVIAAGAVVSKDVEPYTIVGGVPAKEIGRRFPKEIGDQLEAIAWWNWDHEVLRSRLNDFRNCNIENFIRKFG